VSRCIVGLLAAALGAAAYARAPQDQKASGWIVDDEPFRVSARHWYRGDDEEGVVRPLPSQRRYETTEGRAIADNVLLYQKENGGWPKNYDMYAVLTEEQRATVHASRGGVNTTFDNGATYSHVTFLAEAYARTGDERYREACLRGIDFMLAAQNRSGGWPQFYPDTSGYRRYITFNDGAMAGVMHVLLRIAQGDPSFLFVDSTRVRHVRTAVRRGVECILRCQVVQGGLPTVWAQQHDDLDYRPRGARSYEPAALASLESAGIMRLLMRLDRPGVDVISAVKHAAAWFEGATIRGIRVEVVGDPAIGTDALTSGRDVRVVADSAAPPLWARYYALGTGRPLFCNRDGRVVYSLAEVERERRMGYAWYCRDPQAALQAFRAWQSRVAPGTSDDHGD
jgi:PelA/Pel-15E family pectate lyase